MMTDGTEYEQLTTGNLIYQRNHARWLYLYNSYIGGQEYKDGHYLTKYQLETPAEYNARIQTTPLQNHCASVISVYNSFLFRECPDRNYGSIANLPELADFIDDVDYEGRSLDNFMKEISTWAGVFGHCWVMVTKANINAVTLADEQANGVRPYLSLLTPMVVLDWSWERSINGKYDLSFLRYVEEVNGSNQTIKTWTKDLITTHEVNINDKTIMSYVEEENQLGKIPAVIAYNARSITRGVGVSAINDIADMQKSIYNSLSEVDQSIRLDSHPSLVKTAETLAGIGAGSIIQMPENLDPQLKPFILDFAGANIQNIYLSIDNAVGAIEKMAALGAVRSTQASAMSGVALDTEFQLLNSKLSEMADNLELAEEQMWRLWCEYQGQTYDMDIDYPNSFNIHDTNSEITQLKIAADTNPADPRVKAGIDAKILDWLELDEDELAAIADPTLLDLETITESGEIPEA